MKQNQKNRYNGRYNNRNSRSVITRNTSLESSGPCGKMHGTALQLFEKYQTAAKDALIQNDIIQAEICLQYADHYIRMQNIAIANEMANRPQPQQQPQKQQEVVTDELPPVTVEAASEKPAETAPVSSAEAVIQPDVSVPVAAMQETQNAARPRRQLKPRPQPKPVVQTETAPAENA